MDSLKKCKMMDCCRMHRCGMVGMVLIVIASILTIITSSGLGIFGMFIAGLGMCCHKSLLCRCKCCGEECGDDSKCDVVVKEPKKATKKSA